MRSPQNKIRIRLTLVVMRIAAISMTEERDEGAAARSIAGWKQAAVGSRVAIMAA